jgi:hypothetical protein
MVKKEKVDFIMKCKMSATTFRGLFWILVVLVVLCVACCAYYLVSAKDSTGWRYAAAMVAGSAILIGHHVSFGGRCHGAMVYAAISDTLALVALIVLFVLLVRTTSPQLN